MAFNREVLFKSQTVEWPTPVAVYDALNAEFEFNFDPCPLGGTDDGLATLFCSWAGKRVFCNPPYGPGMEKWLQRGLEAAVAVFLIPARTDTRWFHEWVLPFAKEVRFIKGRLKFGNATTGAPFPSMLVVYESDNSMTESQIEKKLKSIVCVCDQPKQKGKPFCRKCFTKLPDDLKQRLSNQLVEDFLTAYDEAKTHLQSN